MSPEIATTCRRVPFEDSRDVSRGPDLSRFQCELFGCEVGSPGNIDTVTPDVLIILGGLIGAYESEKLPAPLQEPTLLRWRLELGCLPIGYSTALESAGIDPATLLTQAQQHGKRFALAGRAMFADWLEKPSLMN